MAKLQTYRPHIEVDAVITLNLGELRALNALVGYGVDELIQHFYKHMGEAYLKPYEHGLRSFLNAAASVNLGPIKAAQRALEMHHIEKGRPLAALSEVQDDPAVKGASTVHVALTPKVTS